jgi:hypothetical protein
MNKKYCRNIIFTKTPFKSHFYHFDRFQIYPCDYPDAPKSDNAQDFPLILEWWMDEDEKPDVSEHFEEIKDFMSDMDHIRTTRNEITRILSALTNHRFFSYENTDIKWGIEFPEKVDTASLSEEELARMNNVSSKSFTMLYYYPKVGYDMGTSGFSTQTHSSPEFVKYPRYFFDDPLDGRNKTLTLPNSLNIALMGYYRLDAKSKKIVNTVAHLICNGIDLRDKMKSLSFLSFVSAIETLVNFVYKDQKDQIEFECKSCQRIKSSPIHCPQCDNPIWGVKAKFKAFLSEYISDDEKSITKYGKIYNLRSDIVHNGALLLGDEQSNWDKSTKADSQYITHIEAMQYARLSLNNWLIRELLKWAKPEG